MNKRTKELLEKGQYWIFEDNLEKTMAGISHDNSEYLKDHLGEKLFITCRWVELLGVWELSASTIPIGLDLMESKCSETTSFVPQISASGPKEPYLKQVSGPGWSATQVISSDKTDTSLTSQPAGNWSDILDDTCERVREAAYNLTDLLCCSLKSMESVIQNAIPKNEVDLSNLHGDELVDAIREYWRVEHGER